MGPTYDEAGCQESDPHNGAPACKTQVVWGHMLEADSSLQASLPALCVRGIREAA